MNDTNLNTAKHPTAYEILVNNKPVSFSEPKVTGKQILEKSQLTPSSCYSLYQKLKGCDFERISLDDLVDLSHPELEHFVTKEPEVFHYTINGEPEMIDKKIVTPEEILQLAAIDATENYVVHLLPNGQKEVFAFQPREAIKMDCRGMEFISAKWLALVDIEEYGKQCKDVPPARAYRIKVDKNYYSVNMPYITGKQIIDLEKKQQVTKFDVFAFFGNQPKPKKIGLDEKISLMQKCLIRFVLQPKEQQDGETSRRQFSLPREDEDFLNKLGLPWETLSNGGLWLLLHNYPIPDGYTTLRSILALMIAPNYPAAEIDMAYFYPHLQKTSGRGITATTPQMIDGKNFQRWSRHRQAGGYNLRSRNIGVNSG